MSGNFFLDWAILVVSLFNTIILLWLGLTILLNAERRRPGIWLAGGGMLIGAAFFLSHSAILGFDPYRDTAVNFWWQLGWIPVILSPFAWYVVMLWYAGFWERAAPAGLRPAPAYRRHRLWFWLLSMATAGMIALFIFASPLPSFGQLTHFDLSAAPSLMGVPLLILFYPLFMVACIALSLDALLRPGPTIRVMGQLARQRARPWLAAASLALLLVSLLVSVILWWAAMARRDYAAIFTLVRAAPWADLIISLLIAIAVTLTGQAIVSYEVFTGKTLPRRGLQRYWHRALILAGGYSFLVSLSLMLSLPSIYILLLSACLLVLFYALLSWRSYAERERFIADLRPFIASSQLYDRLLATALPDEMLDMRGPFSALCENVLGARSAFLIPLGPLAPLFGPSLSHPPAEETSGESPPGWMARLSTELGSALQSTTSSPALCMPLDPEQFGGAVWAVPLWSERGLCGVFLLGEKQDGGLFTQEEIEIARSAGERLVDLQASAEMARRLMALQRQRLSESQVGDRRARRTLHDDILPRLHAAMLSLSSLENVEHSTISEPLALLSDIHHQLSDLLRELPPATPPEVTRLGLVGALQEVAQGELKHAFDEVRWQVTAPAAEKARQVPPLAQEVLFYAGREAMRNAACHARPSHSDAPLCLKVSLSWEDGLMISIEDNGVGITSQGSPAVSGHGLALHSTLMAVIGGSLSIESLPGAYTRVQLYLPEISLAVTNHRMI